MQNNVAREVVKALSLELLPSELAILEEARPVIPEAHDAYLKGMFHYMKSTPTDPEIAEKYFDLALEKDPSYAPAYSGHAFVWFVCNKLAFVAPEVAIAAARKALLLQPDSPVAADTLLAQEGSRHIFHTARGTPL